MSTPNRRPVIPVPDEPTAAQAADPRGRAGGGFVNTCRDCGAERVVLVPGTREQKFVGVTWGCPNRDYGLHRCLTTVLVPSGGLLAQLAEQRRAAPANPGTPVRPLRHR